MKVLTVDDDVNVRKVVRDMVLSLGIECQTAANGKEALEMIKKDRFPILLSDIRMPVMDGISLLKEVRSMSPDTEVIFITGYCSDYSFAEMINLGASDFIPKPFSKDELVAKLNRITREMELRHKIIEEQKQLSETKQFLDNIIDSSLDLIVVGDATGNVTRVNRAFLRLIGCTDEEVLGKHIMELSVTEEGTYQSTTGEEIAITGEFMERSKKQIGLLLEEGKIANWESYYTRRDAVIVPVEMNIIFLYDREGTVIGSVGISRDITERRKLEVENARLLQEARETLEELKQTQSYMLQSEKMASIGQLAAGVAHEINNPTGFVHSNLGSLNKYTARLLELIEKYEAGIASFKNNGGGSNIASFCQEIDDLKKKLKIDFIVKDLKKVITDSLEGTERIKKIVSDLKSFSHVDQEEFKPSDINQGIESTLNVVWNELKYKCTVEKDYGDLPRIHCNLGQLNQVFANLLVNASHAIAEKGTIRITTRHLNGQSGNGNGAPGPVEVSISDTGCGIPEDTMKRIFEPFFTTKEVGKGTGLGLSIAYDIVTKKHRGSIDVASEPGKGTTFTIRLPVLEDKDRIATASSGL